MDGPRLNGGIGGGSGGGGRDGQDPTHNIEELTEKAVEDQHNKESAAGTDYKGEGSAGAAVSVQLGDLSTADITEATTHSKVNRKNLAGTSSIQSSTGYLLTVVKPADSNSPTAPTIPVSFESAPVGVGSGCSHTAVLKH